MPKTDKRNALQRQWTMLGKIPRRPPGITAAELCAHLAEEGYPVSKRTVERDLHILVEGGLPLTCNDASPPFGWYFPKEVDATWASLDLDEALSLRMAEEVLRASLPPAFVEALEPRFESARKRLAYNAGSPQARWRTKIASVDPALRLLPPKIDEAVLRVVQLGVLNERCLEVNYRSHAGGRVAQCTLHPLGLVRRGVVVYLIATAFDYVDVRQYALHRMVGAVATETRRRLPKGFRLDRYIASEAMGFGDAAPIQLVARISGDLAHYLSETPISKDQQIGGAGEDGMRTLRGSVRNTWQLHWWILSHGAGMVVREPESLRVYVAAILRSAAAAYEME